MSPAKNPLHQYSYSYSDTSLAAVYAALSEWTSLMTSVLGTLHLEESRVFWEGDSWVGEMLLMNRPVADDNLAPAS